MDHRRTSRHVSLYHGRLIGGTGQAKVDRDAGVGLGDEDVGGLVGTIVHVFLVGEKSGGRRQTAGKIGGADG